MKKGPNLIAQADLSLNYLCTLYDTCFREVNKLNYRHSFSLTTATAADCSESSLFVTLVDSKQINKLSPLFIFFI